MFSEKEKALMVGLYSRLTAIKKAHPECLLITIKELTGNLPVEQIRLIDKIISITPKDYGINLPYFGLAPFVPANLVRLDDWPGQFLPLPIFLYYYCLNQAIIRDLSCPIIVRDGYRSDAEQLRVFMGRLIYKNWKVEETLKEVSLPGYSQHSYPKANGNYLQAIDFAANGSARFAQTAHYEWLKYNGQPFGFFEPFRKNNEFNINPEEWHWACCV